MLTRGEARVAGATKSASGSSIGETFSAYVFINRSADACKPLNDRHHAANEATPSTNLDDEEVLRKLKSNIKLTDYQLSTMVVPIYTRLLKVVPRGSGPTSTDQAGGFRCFCHVL